MILLMIWFFFLLELFFHFLRPLYTNTASSWPFPFQLLPALKFTISSLVIIVADIHITYVCILMCIYNLLSLSPFARLHMSMADCLGLHDQWGRSSLEETGSPSLSSRWLPVAPLQGRDLVEFPRSTLAGPLVMSLFRQLYRWDFMRAALLSCISQSFQSSFCSCFLGHRGRGCLVDDVSIGAGPLRSLVLYF